MSRLLLFLPLLITVACTQGGDADDTDPSSSDDTDPTSSDDGDTDAAGTDTDGTDTDGGGAVLASSWTGTWSFTFQYTQQDYSYPGPGQLWANVDSSCATGDMTLTVSESGEISVPAPYGACTRGSQIGWSHAIVDATVSDDGTHAISGNAVFGTVGGAGFSGGMGIEVTGTITADGENPLGLMTITGSRSQTQMQPTENLSFSATLRPTGAAPR